MLLAAYHWFLRPSFVQARLVETVAALTDARLKIDLKYASPLFGLEAENIELRDERFDLLIFRASRLRLRWFLPGFFAGHIGLREATLEDGHLALLATEDGGWNLDALRGPPGPTEEKETETTGPDEIDLYLPLKFFLYLDLKDFRFEMRSKDTALDLQNVNLRAGFVTATMTRLPLGLELVENFDALALLAGGETPLRVDYRAPTGSVKGPLALALHLHRDTDLSAADLSSRLRLDSGELQLGRPGRGPLPLGLKLAYDIDFLAEQDRLAIPHFTAHFHGDPWLALNGDMFGTTSRSRYLSLKLRESLIDLGRLHEVLQRLPGLDVPALAGRIRLGGLVAEGPLEKLALDGKLTAAEVRVDRDWSFPEVRADLKGAVDLYKITPFLKPPADYDPDRKLAFGVIHRLRAPDLFAIFNGGRLNADVTIAPATGIKARANLTGFPLEFFTGPYLAGRLGAELDFVSNENFDVLKIKGVARLDGMRYLIDRSLSAVQSAKTLLDGTIRLTEEAVLLDFENIDLQVRDTAGNQFLQLIGDLGMRFDEGMVYKIDARKLSVDYPVMRPTMPGYLQYELAPYRRYFSQGLRLTSKLDLSFYDTSTVDGTALVEVPFLNLNDLSARFDLAFGETFMVFRRLEVSGLREALSARMQGEMRTDAKGLWRPNLKASLDLARDKRTKIHPNIAMSGLLHAEVNARPAETRGQLRIRNFDLNYAGDTPRKTDVTNHPLELDVRGVNLELPFTHDLHLRQPRRLNERAGELFIRNYGFHRTPNLTLSHVSSSHNPRGQYKSDRYYYLGGPGRAGLRARLVYEKNVLYIPWLESLVKHGRSGKKDGAGTINGRNMYFNLADLDTKNMEYGADVQIQDLDLEPYLPFSRGNYDGRISADLKLRGRDLVEPLRTMDARLSVYRLSPEFSGFATRLVMPERLIAGIVNNTVSIPSIRVELKEGLVYSSVTMSRGGLGGVLVKPAREELKQERVPLAQFTARSREVVNEFGQTGAAGAEVQAQ